MDTEGLAKEQSRIESELRGTVSSHAQSSKPKSQRLTNVLKPPTDINSLNTKLMNQSTCARFCL